MNKKAILTWIEDNKSSLEDVAQKIWENPELGLHEEKSSQILIEVLEKEGFKVDRGVAGMPTAFVATYGNKSPRIGILGEYDALPALSQKVKSTQEPIEEGKPGHGCGHNLLGTGSLGAAVAIKQAIEKGGLEGTIVYYGCPAEENVSGKIFMARDGIFDDIDAVLGWHPMNITGVWSLSTLALNSLEFNFIGQSAHAVATPEMGRSALDAAELMNIGTQFMREHIVYAEVHYVITNGGRAPNVVPSKATNWYYIRAPKRDYVEEMTDWIRDIAKGATLMTQTRVEEKFLKGEFEFLPNRTIGNLIYANMEEVGPIMYSEEEKKFAREINRTVEREKARNTLERMFHLPERKIEDMLDHDLYSEVLEPWGEGIVWPATTDVGDVSHIVTTAQFFATAWPTFVAAHTWQAVASNGSSYGRKAAIFAAKVLAATTFDLLTNKAKLDEAKSEFEEATRGQTYKPCLPEGVKPCPTVTPS